MCIVPVTLYVCVYVCRLSSEGVELLSKLLQVNKHLYTSCVFLFCLFFFNLAKLLKKKLKLSKKFAIIMASLLFWVFVSVM